MIIALREADTEISRALVPLDVLTSVMMRLWVTQDKFGREFMRLEGEDACPILHLTVVTAQEEAFAWQITTRGGNLADDFAWSVVSRTHHLIQSQPTVTPSKYVNSHPELKRSLVKSTSTEELMEDISATAFRIVEPGLDDLQSRGPHHWQDLTVGNMESYYDSFRAMTVHTVFPCVLKQLEATLIPEGVKDKLEKHMGFKDFWLDYFQDKLETRREIFREMPEGFSICDNLRCQRGRPVEGATIKQCSCCHTVIYCSEHCQKEDWVRYHRAERRAASPEHTHGLWYTHATRRFHVYLIQRVYNAQCQRNHDDFSSSVPTLALNEWFTLIRTKRIQFLMSPYPLSPLPEGNPNYRPEYGNEGGHVWEVEGDAFDWERECEEGEVDVAEGMFHIGLDVTVFLTVLLHQEHASTNWEAGHGVARIPSSVRAIEQIEWILQVVSPVAAWCILVIDFYVFDLCPKQSSKAHFRREIMAVSAFDTLPDDLLCEIFIRCLPSNHWETTPKPSKQPTALTLVCKRWRSVALTFPLLWCWMKLSPSREVWKNRKVCQRTIKNFRDVLTRSKSAPLSLMVRSEIVEMGDVTVNTFLACTLQVATSSLTRLVLFAVPICQLEGLASGMFPTLQSIVFCMVESGEDGTGNSSVVAFREAPSLRRIVLDTTFFVYADTPCFALPWSQLTHFLDCDGYNSCTPLFTRHIIEQKPQLRWLGLDVAEEDTEQLDREPWQQPARLDFVTMDTIATLTLNFEWEIGYLSLFDWVEFPNLQTLRLTAMEADALGGHTDRFFAKLQTFKELQFLSMQVDAIDPSVLESTLKSVPTVRTLDLFLDRPYGTIFQLLETNQELLPHLHTLALASWAPKETEVGQGWIPALDLRNLLEARTSGAHPTPVSRSLSSGPRNLLMLATSRKHGEIDLECHVGKVEERNVKVWMEMDPGSQGWEEAGEAAHFLATLYTDGSNFPDDDGTDWYDDGPSW
ncbi:hypothetical protein FA13DRAFT_1713514 [Coprinellus micaceus]|uniref:MYND-type domain-containing protein n=1 Tax=Coprinellus micaceus TaxID=71717 RepID=A0A4Y7SW48_COPMI|nr:hypothetical protein FA13DRAFT_1713514 [Coprinellus micaceus]